MRATLPGISTNEAIAALEGNLWSMWSAFGRGEGCLLVDEPGLLRFETPLAHVPYNAIMRFQVDRRVDETVDELLDLYSRREVPLMWVVHPTTRPTDLVDRLEARGLVEAEVVPGMVARLGDLPSLTFANVEMAAAWDGDEGEHWTEHADRYEKAADRHWQALLRTVDISRADSVLDVGCGTGKSSRDTARIAASGSVLGVDLSSRMLEYARVTAEREGLTNVRFEQADAQVHPFPSGAFDVALSCFGTMFFADPVAAFVNIERSLRPGGRLALLSWRELERNEWLAEIRAALAVGRHLPTPPPGAPGPFGLAEADHVERVLTKAGFGALRFDEVDEPINLGTDADDAFSFARTLGITKGLTGDLDAASRTEALSALKRTLAEHETEKGVLLGSSAWLITARSEASTS